MRRMSIVFRRPDALQRGATDRELQRMCNTGRWRRLRPGSFTDSTEYDALDAVAQHRMRAESALRAASADAVLSHQSAAVVHGLDLWHTPLRAVHLTRDRRTGGSRSALRHVHSAGLDRSEVVEVAGRRVTSLARTVVDLARTLPFEQALVAGDHALHGTALTPDLLEDALGSIAGRPGSRRARRVVDHLDGRAESVGESRSRAMFIRKHLPLPELQPNLYSDGGEHLGRVDLLLGEHHVICEFDGRVKYGRLVPVGQVPADVLWAEKLREDRLRDAGWQVVRWIWDELATPQVIIERVHRAIARARKSPPPTGRIEHTPKP